MEKPKQFEIGELLINNGGYQKLPAKSSRLS
jgi:hypothetical protein